MHLHILAIGRLRRGAEFDLVADYTRRFTKLGRSLGMSQLEIHEIDERRATNKASQAERLKDALPKGAKICCLDERGKSETSPQFATRLARWRDTGCSDVAFLIGGADGLSAELTEQADHLLSLGPMVWPHMLARVMLTEQLYRAASILSGTPYHRA